MIENNNQKWVVVLMDAARKMASRATRPIAQLAVAIGSAMETIKG